MRDPQALKYYFTTYDDQNIQMIDLNKIDFGTKALKSFNVAADKTPVNDITASLK